MCCAFLCALVAASTALILLMTRTGAGGSTGPSSLAALCHWMGRTYGAQYGTGDTSPNLSLIWYLKIEVFPEMAPTFLTMFHAQPLLVAAPLYWELWTRPSALILCQLVVINTFKAQLRAGVLWVQLLCCLALPRGGSGANVSNNSHAFTWYVVGCAYAAIAGLLPVVHALWLDAGTLNANFYWALAIAFAVTQLMLVVTVITAGGSGEGKGARAAKAKLQ